MPIRERQKNMPDVPDLDFVGSLCEIWSGINYAAYHLSYVRIYLETEALQTPTDTIRKQEQSVRDLVQTDVLICRAHVAAFFWHLDHVFEALRTATTRGQQEHPDLQYFWNCEKRLDEIEETSIRKEIKAYRNKGHDIPAIIGCLWDQKSGKFLRHFLPVLAGHEKDEVVDMNIRMQQYFEFVTNIWFSFAPGDYKTKFPRDFSFPVTIPHTYVGDLPPELRDARQLEVQLQARQN